MDKYLEALLERILVAGSSDLTLEQEQGCTYGSSDQALYAHGVYPRSSVLAGQPRRVFIDSWGSMEEATHDLREIGILSKVAILDGSTYCEPSLSHLDDGPDY